MKDVVFSDLPDTIQELRDRGTQAVCNIHENISKIVYKNIKTDLCFLLMKEG